MRSMPVLVTPKLRQARGALQNVSTISFAGRDLPERLRSVPIGMVGLAAAAGLGVIALATSAGFPDVSGGPIPDLPETHIGAARVVARDSRPVAGPAGPD